MWASLARNAAARRVLGGLAACAIALIALQALTTPWSKTVGRRVVWDVAISPLEKRFERLGEDDVAAADGIIVLGGGEERLREAGRLAREWGNLRLVVSGAGTPSYVWSLLGPGIAPERVVIETISRSTYDNAINSSKIVAALGGDRWLLVTSAVHMPRSMGVFRKAGLKPEAWPVYDLPASGWQAFVVARHEWLGLAWYRLLSRIDSSFPGPTLAS